VIAVRQFGAIQPSVVFRLSCGMDALAGHVVPGRARASAPGLCERGGSWARQAEQRREGYALITGALSGIGYELARDCMADCRVIPADLSMMSGVEEVHRRVRESNLTVYVLVNDAGIGSYGPFVETDFNKESEMINLNVLGLSYMTRLFAADMVVSGSGKVLNVASTAGFWPVPHMSV
jgi:short-subunit dehydrogenase